MQTNGKVSNELAQPDPLQLALTAIGDFDRAFVLQDHTTQDMGDLYQRALLRVLYALAADVRKMRHEFQIHGDYLARADGRNHMLEMMVQGSKDGTA